MSAQRYPVGIDLGTTFSSLAYIDDNGQPQAIRLTDDDGTIGSTSYSLASAVYFKSLDEIVVGNRALEYSILDASRIATRFKRQMGDPLYLRDLRDEQHTHVPFEVDGQSFRPEELSALVLKRLKAAGEAQLGPINDVVISVPFVFDEARRRATQNAGKIAGFDKIELIDEPVAAAMAYGHNLFQGQASYFSDKEMQDVVGNQRILVYDLGGGTFDATIVYLQTNGIFEVLATNGDERLGGSDWDEVLLDIVCTQFIDQTGENPRQSPELLQELLLKTIEAKKTLSVKNRAEIEIDFNGQTLTLMVPVGAFNTGSRHLVSRTTDTINEMFAQKEWSWGHCDKIVVVGGASRMPMITKHIKQLCNRDIDMSLSPDTAIAFGAALFAALKSGHKTGLIEDVQTVNSHALGLLVKNPRTNETLNDIIIPQNTKTRTTTKKTYPVQDANRGVTLVVMQGNSEDPEVCLKVGRLRIKPQPGAKIPASTKPSVAVTFSFQDNGLLRVSGELFPGPGQKPVEAAVELAVENTMSEEQVEESKSRYRGIDVEQ